MQAKPTRKTENIRRERDKRTTLGEGTKTKTVWPGSERRGRRAEGNYFRKKKRLRGWENRAKEHEEICGIDAYAQ